MTRGHHALIVEDTHDVAEDVQAILESMGHTSVVVKNQKDAEEILENESFCFVLQDLNIPVRKNKFASKEIGYNLLDWIVGRFAREDLPVIMMTAHGREYHYGVRAVREGAADFILKPFDQDPETLEEKIRKVLAFGCEDRHEDCPNGGGAPAAPRPPGGRKKATARKTPSRARAAKTSARSSRERKGSKRPTIHLVGFVKKRRYLIEVNGEQVWIRLRSFECLGRLVAPLVAGDSPGWTPGAQLGEKPHNVIYRLKEDLEECMSVDGLIVNDGHGNYRLSIPAENLSFAESVLRDDHPVLFELLT